ncbi:MAG: phosphatase PAP2 family protein [Sandaracinaceae bacterium]|nr:phosphatase PAP2 family protein [Sandaracinaceae bacterium]
MGDNAVGATTAEDRPSFLGRLYGNMAAHDWFCVVYHLGMFLRVMVAPDSENAFIARRFSGILLAATALALLITRGEILPKGLARAIAYRVGIFTPIFVSYFELRYLLPALQPHLLDAELYRIDQVLFGRSPAEYLDAFVTPSTTEWFAFFYFSYFAIMGSYLILSVFLDRGQRLSEIMTGAAVLASVGHLTYTLVPGFGPHVYLHNFAHELTGGIWWQRVNVAVNGSGAMLDIFPSLHTAYPTFYTLHAFRHRKAMPFKYAWIVTAFFTGNIIIATVFLRWHWGIDLVAGIALAICAQQAGIFFARKQAARDSATWARQEVWEPLRQKPEQSAA